MLLLVSSVMSFAHNLQCASFLVRGRRARNVFDGVPEELLHRHEEARPEKAAESYPKAAERNSCSLLRHIALQKVKISKKNKELWLIIVFIQVRNRHLCPDFPKHDQHGH